MIHIPLLRRGEPYRSLDVVRLPHYQTREPFVEISQANIGLIRRDLLHQEKSRARASEFLNPGTSENLPEGGGLIREFIFAAWRCPTDT